jgi:hypothetical protein
VLQSALESAPGGPVDWASVFAGAERVLLLGQACGGRRVPGAARPIRPS